MPEIRLLSITRNDRPGTIHHQLEGIHLKNTPNSRGEMLLAIFKYKYSLTILQEEGWYHIPVKHTPITWPPRWVCFYQGKAFKDDNQAYQVEYYGEVAGIDIVPYRELFPNLIESKKSDFLYYRVRIKELKQLDHPIPSYRPRRLVFIPTTWAKFESAEQINDLFNESPLEDLMWKELKTLRIKAERQWVLPIEKSLYYLDFAVFCNNGFIDIETDGDTWHATKERIASDNTRNNKIAQMGWQVLRYNGEQLHSSMRECVHRVRETIKTLDGLSDDGLVPRIIYQHENQTVQPLSLFDQKTPYTLISGAEENLEE